jgi:hypothetical protein
VTHDKKHPVNHCGADIRVAQQLLHRADVGASECGSNPANEKTYPIKVSLFSLEAIVLITNPLLHLIEQAGRFQRRSAGFHEKFMPVYKWLC